MYLPYFPTPSGMQYIPGLVYIFEGPDTPTPAAHQLNGDSCQSKKKTGAEVQTAGEYKKTNQQLAVTRHWTQMQKPE